MNTKRTLACAALLLGLLSFNAPLTAAVESDIVGYTTVEPGSSWTLLGINFASLTDTKYSIQQIVGDFADGDEAQLWDGTRYTTVVYYTEATAGQAGFYNDDGTLSTLSVSPGSALWLKSSSVKQVTLAGKVLVNAQSEPLEGNSGWSLFAARTPVATSVNAFSFKGLSDGDEMQIWDGGQYVSVIYYSAETAGMAGFYEETGTLSTREVPVGSGFWIKSAKTVTME